MQLGPGPFVHAAANQRGSIAFAWEHFAGGVARADAGKTVGLALSLDALVRLDGPHALPGSDTVTTAVQSAVVAHDRIDVFVDASAGRVIRWRSGRRVD